jgi:hypothetical protein
MFGDERRVKKRCEYFVICINNSTVLSVITLQMRKLSSSSVGGQQAIISASLDRVAYPAEDKNDSSALIAALVPNIPPCSGMFASRT